MVWVLNTHLRGSNSQKTRRIKDIFHLKTTILKPTNASITAFDVPIHPGIRHSHASPPFNFFFRRSFYITTRMRYGNNTYYITKPCLRTFYTTSRLLPPCGEDDNVMACGSTGYGGYGTDAITDTYVMKPNKPSRREYNLYRHGHWRNNSAMNNINSNSTVLIYLGFQPRDIFYLFFCIYFILIKIHDYITFFVSLLFLESSIYIPMRVGYTDSCKTIDPLFYNNRTIKIRLSQWSVPI